MINFYLQTFLARCHLGKSGITHEQPDVKLKIISIGKTTEKYLQNGIDQYLDRLKHYANVEWLELPGLKQSKKLTDTQVMAGEAEKIRQHLAPGTYLIVLDERGKQHTSAQLAQVLSQRMVSGVREVAIVVGGAYGTGRQLRQQAHLVLSFSKLTFTHQMIRLLLAEQLYRSMTIIRNEPYHHE